MPWYAMYIHTSPFVKKEKKGKGREKRKGINEKRGEREEYDFLDIVLIHQYNSTRKESSVKPAGEGKLEFSLDMKSGVPFYKQIIFQVEMGIADGRLEQGVQLPTVRSLAVDLSINPNTVARAYAEMEIRNIVVTQQGSGTFISDKKINLNAIEREQVLSAITKGYLTKAASFGFSLQEIRESIDELGTELKQREEPS